MRIPCGLTQYLAPCLGGADAIKYRGLLPAGCYWCHVVFQETGGIRCTLCSFTTSGPQPETQSFSVRLKPHAKCLQLEGEDSHIANS